MIDYGSSERTELKDDALVYLPTRVALSAAVLEVLLNAISQIEP
jgi:hypothetical protein